MSSSVQIIARRWRGATLDTGWFIVLTKTEGECYQALGLVHKLYQPVKGQFRDLIAAGKENGYRALYTEVRHS